MSGRGARRRDRRTHRIPVRFTYQELSEARKRAYRAGRPLARYIRERALGQMPRALRLQMHDDVVHSISTTIRALESHRHSPAAMITQAEAELRALLNQLTRDS